MTRIGDSQNIQNNQHIQSDNIEKQEQVAKNSIFEDKNENGVTDKDDFTDEQWEKLSHFGTLFENATWTKELSNLIHRIFNRTKPSEDMQKEITITNSYGTKSVLFDDENRILKSVAINEYGYDNSYYEYKLDNDVNITKGVEVFVNDHYIDDNGNNKKISYAMFNDFVASRGFKAVQEQKYTQEEIEHRVELWKKSGAYLEETHMVEDLNNNGVIEEDDFSKEDLAKLQMSSLLSVFQDQKWTPEIVKILSAILHDKPLEEDVIKCDLPANKFGNAKHLIYEAKNRMLKRTTETDGEEYFYYESITFDDNGQVLQQKKLEAKNSYLQDDKVYAIGSDSLNWFVEQEGFSSLKNKQYTDEIANLYNDIFYKENSTVWDITNYKYDNNGKRTEIAQVSAPRYEYGKMPTINMSHTVDNITTTVEQDLKGNFVSKTIWYPAIRKENAEGETTYIEYSIENYDEKDNLLYKTTTKTQYDKPQIVVDEEGEEIEHDSETEVIKEYPNGETYIEKEVLGNIHATLKDANGNVIEEYDISKMYDPQKGKMEITKTYSDGHKVVDYE